VTPAPVREKLPESIRQLSWRQDGKLVHGPASNFFIEPDGTNVESEFQADKLSYMGLNLFVCAAVRKLPPGKAKRYAGPRGPHPMSKREQKIWDGKSRKIMKKRVRQKFFDHDNLADWLLATGTAKIVEENDWHDQVWGSCNCREHFYRRGKNWLGKILVEVREELRSTKVGDDGKRRATFRTTAKA
jgi:hypothetical protein